jgi:hypothetical protein
VGAAPGQTSDVLFSSALGGIACRLVIHTRRVRLN